MLPRSRYRRGTPHIGTGAAGLWLLLLAACSDPVRELRVAGPTPFVRCVGARPRAAGTVTLPRARLRFDEGALRVEGLPTPARIAAFAGPAVHAAPAAAQLEAMRAASLDLVLVLGDVGDDPVVARAGLAALAQLSVPVLVLAGGRDTLLSVADAIASVPQGRDQLIDISALRRVEVASSVFVPLAGAAEGRYASSTHSCGYAASDLASVAAEVRRQPANGHTHWIAWERPEGWPVLDPAEGAADREPVLAQIAQRASGVFAWPPMSEPQSSASLAPGSTWMVPRVTGPAEDLPDGSRRSAGFSLFQLDERGLTPLSE